MAYQVDSGLLQDMYDEQPGEGFVSEYGEEQSEEYTTIKQEVKKNLQRRQLFNQGLDYTLKEDKDAYRLGLEKDLQSYKAFLQREEKAPQKIILYDHLSAVIDKLVTHRPDNAGNVFEEYCRDLRKSKYYPATDHLQDMYVPPQFTESEKILRLLKSVQQHSVSREKVESEEIPQINIMESLNYFEQAGIGFSQLETFCIKIKLQTLVKEKPLKIYRFWGKIHGLYNDYIIAETEQFAAEIQRMQEEEEMEERRRQEEENKRLQEQEERIVRQMEVSHAAAAAAAAVAPEKEKKEEGRKTETADEYGEEEETFRQPPPRSPPEFPPIPVSTFERPPEIPFEKQGEGVNRKVYYVCSRFDDEWIQLPDVTPQQIQVARKIRKLFTGDLEADILTYPPFPGKEKHYLRAQIARISAATLVSPKGFYKLERAGADDEGEEEEEEELPEEEEEGMGKRGGGAVMQNPAYRPKPMKEQVKLRNWVHHQEAILEQGRTTFWAPEKERRGEGEEEEEEEEEEEDEEGVVRKRRVERPPPMFRSLIKDTNPDVKKLWSIQTSSTLMPESAFVLLRSELWPGFFAFAAGSKYDCIYVGWGLKYSPLNYNVPQMPVIHSEYLGGPEIMEMADPTWEQEEAWRIAHEPKPPRSTVSGEGEEEEEEEESEVTGGGDTDDDDE